MSHYKESKLQTVLKRLYISYIPNRRDSLKQILIKSLFIIALVTLLVSAGYLANYFLTAKQQDGIIDDSREIWHKEVTVSDEEDTESSPSKTDILLQQNSDFKGWITIPGTQVDNPIYQTDNNDFYLTHNQEKKKSTYGALYFDYKNIIIENETDKNLVIYGHEMKNGSMFGSLKKLRSLDFYKEHPTIEFSTLYDSGTYKIYSVFVLNAVKADDDGKVYNIYRKNFADEDDFNSWVDEAYARSLINTGVDVQYNDDIITLVTCCEDFENARLIITARKTRHGEDSSVDTRNATANPKPKYPVRWYTKRGLEYPF